MGQIPVIEQEKALFPVMNDEQVVLNLRVRGWDVKASFSVDSGVTPQQREKVTELRLRSTCPANQIEVDGKGVRFKWDDGWKFEYEPPAWQRWWGNRKSSRGEKALNLLEEFSAYLYREVVGRKLEHEIAARRMSVFEAFRDFPEVIDHSPEIRARLHAEMEVRGKIAASRGERTREDRVATLDRLMTTYSRVQEFLRQGLSLNMACETVATAERRGGRTPGAAVRREYERATMEFRRLFHTK